MASTIVIKNSSTTSAVPATGDLTQGELAVNVTDKKIFTKNSSGTVVRIVGTLGNQEASAVAITGGTITGMSSPSGSSDVSTKGYVDGLITTNAGYATAAAASASAASTSASSASSSASSASTSASTASTAATNATTAQTAAEAARDATLAAYDQFDDRYLGSKTSDPTVDNDGNALVAGSLYYNSSSQIMKLYTGSSWVAAYVSGAGYLASASNLSDVASASTSRSNLGLGNVDNTSDATKNSATATLTNKTIEAGTFTNGYTEEVATANTSTAYTIDLANGTVQILTLTGNCTFTFPTATAGKSFILLLKQDGTGSRTATWPSAVKWPAGTAPTITSTASKLDKYIFTADGTNWYGSDAGKNYTV